MSARLAVEALTPAAFADFGEVIEAAAARVVFAINAGTTTRYHALAIAEAEGGAVAISIARAQPRSLPFEVRLLERHPLGSQAFVPLAGTRWLVVVADAPQARPRAFLAANGQGVQYRRGCWHHPLIALDDGGDFLIVDRVGPGDNCQEAQWSPGWWIEGL
ncbi:MAG: ureidoglycolate lyase [Xanthomonadales bacterium]|nr:Ureidoglycolate lyase [Xanthomonadales bacterium]MCC6592589.1 ureidoglycolate lyase [Xanthomonadales bacterium]MCE7931674.1 ureidoglycolate lyase [Xanthomonadales bacterium PRO6]